MLVVESSRTDPNDDVVDVTSFTALDAVQIKSRLSSFLLSRTDPDNDVVVVGARRC